MLKRAESPQIATYQQHVTSSVTSVIMGPVDCSSWDGVGSRHRRARTSAQSLTRWWLRPNAPVRRSPRYHHTPTTEPTVPVPQWSRIRRPHHLLLRPTRATDPNSRKPFYDCMALGQSLLIHRTKPPN
jgi:hypothetical protein